MSTRNLYRIERAVKSIIFLPPDPQLFRLVRGLALLVRRGRGHAHASNPIGGFEVQLASSTTLTNVIVESCHGGTVELPMVAAGW